MVYPYWLLLAIIRAHNAKEKMRKVEREGGTELEEATPTFDKDGELLPPKTPAMTKMLRTHTHAMQSLPAQRTKIPKARKSLRLGEQKDEEEVQTDNHFNPLIPELAESSDESSDDEETYETRRQLAHQHLLADHAKSLQDACSDLRSQGMTTDSEAEAVKAAKRTYETMREELQAQFEADHVDHLVHVSSKQLKRAEAAKAAKKLRQRHIQGALTHLLDFMAGQKEPPDWFICQDIPTTIHYDRWFGCAYITQQKDSLLAKWQELPSEKADVNPLYPESASAAQQAQYISQQGAY